MNQSLAHLSDSAFKDFIEKLDFGILKQGPSAEILMSNNAALEMLGLTEEQLLGKTSFDPDWNVIHEDGSDFPGPTHPVTVSIATLKPVKNVVMGVYRPKSKDRVWLLVNADPKLDDKGNLLYVTCTFNNISGQMHALELLHKSEAHFRKLFDASPVGISLTSATGQLYVNAAFGKQTGYTEAELNDKSWTEITHPDDIEITRAALERARQQKEQVRVEKRYIHKNGDVVYGDLWMVFNEDTNSYITNIVDITEKKKAEQDLMRLNEELKKSSEELSELSHHMQHLIEKERADLAREIHDELAQKFAAIHMNAELTKQKLAAVAINADIKTLLDEQITLSAEVIKSCKMLFNHLYPTILQDIGLVATVESYIETGNLRFRSFNFTLNTNMREAEICNEDSLMLYRIFQESITNIALHSGAQHVITELWKDAANITMQIADDGKGFDVAAVNTKECHGLLVMRERVYASGGKFSIDSVINGGTVIKVVIPYANQTS